MSDGFPAKGPGRAKRDGLNCLAVLMLIPLVTGSSHARIDADEAPALEEMLRLADSVRHPIDEGVIRIRATVSIPNEPAVESLLDVFVKGRDRVLYLFRAGPLQGRRVLIVEEKTWLLIPDVARPIPISANQRLLGGISIADVARLSFASDYRATLRTEDEMVGQDRCRVIDLRARARNASYPLGTLWISLKNGLPLKAELVLASGKPAKLLYFGSYDHSGDRPILDRMRIVHLLPGEHSMETVLEFSEHERRGLEPAMFDPAKARDVP